LILYPLPSITGFPFVTANSPATVENMGVEFNAKVKIIDTKDLFWAVGFNVGMNNNKLLSFPNIANSPFNYLIVGKSLRMVRLLQYTGVDPQTGKYTYLDVNHDGIIDVSTDATSDLSEVKDLSIKYDGGFSTDLTYKKFGLNLFFHFRGQPNLQSTVFSTVAPGGISNQSTAILNRWQKPGDQAEFAKYTTFPDETDNNISTSTAYYSNGSFIRLKNASLSYTINSTSLKKAGISNMKFFLRGENLFVITKYQGLDPETASLASLPLTKDVVLGFNITF